LRIKGGTYTGWCIGDKPHGYGRFVYETTTDDTGWREYMGDWRGGMRHGHGTLLFRSGARYCGQWKDDKRDGVGVMCYDPGPAQVIFVGFYSQDCITEGTLSTVRDVKSVSYVGKFKDNEMGHKSAWVCCDTEEIKWENTWANTSPEVREFIKKQLERIS